MEQFVVKVQRLTVQCKEKCLIYLQRSSCLRGIGLEEHREGKEEVGSQDTDFFGDQPLESSVSLRIRVKLPTFVLHSYKLSAQNKF